MSDYVTQLRGQLRKPGNLVEIRPGIHKISTPLEVADGVTIVGRGATLLGSGNAHLMQIGGTEGVRIYDLTCDLNTVETFKACVAGDNVTDLVIDRCSLRNSQLAGFNLEDTIFATLLRNCHKIRVTNNNVEALQIKVGGPTPGDNRLDDVHVVGNRISDSIQFGIFLATSSNGASSSRAVVSHNIITNPRSAGILLGDDTSSNSGETSTMCNIMVTHNVVELGTSADRFCKGIYFKCPTSSHSIRIDGNVIDCASVPESFGLVVGDNEPTSTGDFELCHNTIRHPGNEGIRFYTDLCGEALNNTLVGNGFVGIRLLKAPSVTLSNNKLSGFTLDIRD